MTKVTMAHIREAQICMRGARAWFPKHGFSWNDFIENGISAEELESTGDPLAFRATAVARKDVENGS